MSRYEYAYVTLKDGLYVDEAAEALGLLLEECVVNRGMTAPQALDAFLASGLARQFEVFNPKFVCGMTTSELCDWMLRECGWAQVEKGSAALTGISIEAWIGEAAARYQAARGISYGLLLGSVGYDGFVALYYRGNDWGPDQVSQCLDELLAKADGPCALKRFRLNVGLTQAELAQGSGVTLRAIQQYEQNAKDLSHAAAITVLRLARCLGCSAEDLLE